MPEPGADPALVSGWLAARSTARGLPRPVCDHGGWRVDTGSETERRRYVFARPCDGLSALGRSIDDPLTVLKLCAAPEVMAAALSPRWSLDGSGTLMICATPTPVRQPPAGYRVALDRAGRTWRCAVTTDDNALAASGYAVEQDGVFAFDRIVTEPNHQRLGLGSIAMATLAAARNDDASRHVLVATPAGRALYESLGWTAFAPYTTAKLGA